MATEPVAGKGIYAGLFLISLATLTQEILFTRVFSVTLWYHLAFMAISIAVFGMTVGALFVYLLPARFTPERAARNMAISALAFAFSLPASFVLHISMPQGPLFLAATYVVTSVPFFFSGIAVCIALTAFRSQVNKLYAADLAGAASGCMVLIALLTVMDAPSAVLFVAAVAALGAAFFASAGTPARLRRTASVCAVLLVACSAAQIVLARAHRSPLTIRYVKGGVEPQPLYEEWNPFSRIAVFGNPDGWKRPFGWGLSPAYPPDHLVRELYLNIDASAGTVFTSFHGDLNDAAHLKYDVTNMANYLRGNARVLIAGAGGGRDVLSALAFHQQSVTAVEMNRSILDALNGRFGDFTGHLDRLPHVTFVNDEARSYIERQPAGSYDIIQLSLTDTWAATAAGGFILSENSLYTVEAFRAFLDHLSPNGILTVSRWYARGVPAEAYRLVSLATAALRALGIRDPRRHIVLVRCIQDAGSEAGVGTLLLNKQPFTPEELNAIESVAQAMRFDVVVTPGSAMDETFDRISTAGPEWLRNGLSVDISAPTDDRPFFFYMRRMSDMFQRRLFFERWRDFHLQPVSVLAVLLAIVCVLTLLCIVLPLFWTRKRVPLEGSGTLLLFFGAIGCGFMFVEISQMQRMVLFLGHPTYSLSVVLFSLLLSTGLGSFLTSEASEQAGKSRLLQLVLAVAVAGAATPLVTSTFQVMPASLRIGAAVALLFLPGIFMGAAFPLGMRVAARRAPTLTPWLWAVNGATSVCASVVAVQVAISTGISMAFWTGAAFYVIALAAYLVATGGGNRRSAALA